MIVSTISKYVGLEVRVNGHVMRAIRGHDVIFQREQPGLQGVGRCPVREWVITLHQFESPLIKTGDVTLG